MLSPRPTRDSSVCGDDEVFAPPAPCLAPVRQASPALPVADADPYEFSLLDEPLFSRRALDLIAEMHTEPTAKGGGRRRCDDAAARGLPAPLGVPQEDRRRQYGRHLEEAPLRRDRQPGDGPAAPARGARSSRSSGGFARAFPSTRRAPRPPPRPSDAAASHADFRALPAVPPSAAAGLTPTSAPPQFCARAAAPSTRNRRRRHRPLPPPTPQGQPPMQGWKAPPTTPSFARALPPQPICTDSEPTAPTDRVARTL